MLKNFLNRTKCAMGAHEGPWNPVAGQPCLKEQVCIHCQSRRQTAEHTWDEWYYQADGRCEIERSCKRCGATEEEIAHTYQAWQYLRDDDCIQSQVCERCGQISAEQRTSHAWDDWQYVEKYRTTIRRCRRCHTASSIFSDQEIPADTQPEPGLLKDRKTPNAVREPRQRKTGQPAGAQKQTVSQNPEKEPPAGARVEQFIRILSGDNLLERKRLFESMPASPVIEELDQYEDQTLFFLAVAKLAASYARGVEPELGIDLARALLAVCQERYTTAAEARYLYIAGMCGEIWASGLYSQGKNEEIFEITHQLIGWLSKENALRFVPALLLYQAETLLDMGAFDRVEAVLDRAQAVLESDQPELWKKLKAVWQKVYPDLSIAYYSRAEVETFTEVISRAKYFGLWFKQIINDLNAAPWNGDAEDEMKVVKVKAIMHDALLSVTEEQLDGENREDAEKTLANIRTALQERYTAEWDKLLFLRLRFDKRGKVSPTRLPVEKTVRDEVRENRTRMLEQAKALLSQLSPESQQDYQQVIDRLEQMVDENIPETYEEYQAMTRNAYNSSIVLLSGGIPGAEQDHAADVNHRLQNQKRIRNAAGVISEGPAKHDRPELEKAVQELELARSWAEEHHVAEQANDALWALAQGYELLGQVNQAEQSLQALWKNLENLRATIQNPLERAGVFHPYPGIFSRLCWLCYQQKDFAGMLDAIEADKGRVLADAAAKRLNAAPAATEAYRPSADLPARMKQLKASYISYLVQDDAIFAAVVAKDGCIYGEKLPLTRQLLREWVVFIDPATWGKVNKQKGLYAKGESARNPSDIPQKLSPLVSWLENLQILEDGDHVCYSPDAELFLFPLQYVHYQNRPFIMKVSVSRIHSAAFLARLIDKQPSRPHSFLGFILPSDEDLGDTQKLKDLDRAPVWLGRHMKGQIYRGQQVNWKEISSLGWKKRLVHFSMHGTFPQKGQIHARQDPNPYTGSGLLFSRDGKATSSIKALTIEGDAKDALFSPEKALRLNFTGSHVSLMACVSGLAIEGAGGDALGLEWALLYAGAQSLITTHWHVGSNVAAEFSLGFYQKWLVEQKPRSAAWRETLLAMANTQPESYLWAACSLSGDWR